MSFTSYTFKIVIAHKKHIFNGNIVCITIYLYLKEALFVSVNDFENYYLTWKPDKNNLKKPFYKSIALALEHDIRNGILAPHTQLPPQRELADYLDIHFTTITKAYKILENEKLIYGVIGRGTFVSQLENKKIVKNSYEDMIDLAFVSNFDDTNTMIEDFVKRKINKIDITNLLTYDNPEGTTRQKEIASNWLSYLGLKNFSIQNIIVSSGGQNALAITLLSLFNPYEKIAVDEFTYANFIELAKSFNITLVPIPQDESGMKTTILNNACNTQNINGVFLMPNRSNPTNIKITNKRKNELVEVINKHNLILIEDDTFAPLSLKIDKEYVSPMYNKVNNGIYISSTSKYISSGFRVAYMVTSTQFKENISNSMSNINVKTSPLDTELVTQIIETGFVNEIINEKIKLLFKVNHLYHKIFKADDYSLINFFKWIKVSENFSSKLLFDKHKILTLPTNTFDPISKNQQDNFLRVALSTTDNEQLESSLQSILYHI